jgi:LytS/YehU family sensor histidine kinase
LLTESKLSTLKAYINPHFLFNSLNSVNALITSNPEQAREMLINLSEYFRYSLKQKDNNFINFADELHYTFTYFDIERLRFGERIVLKTDIDENISEIKVPVMILQPLFENIIKHAVAESLVQIIVNFNAKINNGFLEIDLENNYDEESIPTKGTGIGLDTTYERLHLIYQNKDLLNYSKNKGIFKLNLKIPIN